MSDNLVGREVRCHFIGGLSVRGTVLGWPRSSWVALDRPLSGSEQTLVNYTKITFIEVLPEKEKGA